MTNAIISKESYSVNVNPAVFGYPDSVCQDDIQLFAGIAYCDNVKKDATKAFLDEYAIRTPAMLQETVVNMGLVPATVKVESFAKKVEKGTIKRTEKDGLEFVYSADGSCVPVLILQGIAACFNALRVRKSRNKKDVMNLTADLCAILAELETGKDAEQYRNAYDKKKEALLLSCQYYIGYNPDILDIPPAERIETHSKHGTFFFAHGMNWNDAFEQAVAKGKTAEVKAHIAAKPQTRKEALLECVEAYQQNALVNMTVPELIAELARYIKEQ